MRELRETKYQFRGDFIVDSSAAQMTFGLKADALGGYCYCDRPGPIG